MFYAIYYKDNLLIHKPFKSLVSVLLFIEENPRNFLGFHCDSCRGYNNSEFKKSFKQINEDSLLVLTRNELLGDPREGAYLVELVIPSISALTEEELNRQRKIYRAAPPKTIMSLEGLILKYRSNLIRSLKKEETHIKENLLMCEKRSAEYHKTITDYARSISTGKCPNQGIETRGSSNPVNELFNLGRDIVKAYERIKETKILFEFYNDSYSKLQRIRTKYNLYN